MQLLLDRVQMLLELSHPQVLEQGVQSSDLLSQRVDARICFIEGFLQTLTYVTDGLLYNLGVYLALMLNISSSRD